MKHRPYQEPLCDERQNVFDRAKEIMGYWPVPGKWRGEDYETFEQAYKQAAQEYDQD